MFDQTKIDLEFVSAVKSIAASLAEANRLKKIELGLLSMRARPNCRREDGEGQFLELLTQRGREAM